MQEVYDLLIAIATIGIIYLIVQQVLKKYPADTSSHPNNRNQNQNQNNNNRNTNERNNNSRGPVSSSFYSIGKILWSKEMILSEPNEY